MSDRTPSLITTSASSWLGASLGSEIGSLIVLPIGFLISIWLRSHGMFYLTIAGWCVFAGTGGYWIRRHRYRFDLQRQILERHTLWFFRSTHVQQIHFDQINSFQVIDSKHGPRLLMQTHSGGKWVVKAGSRQRLEPVRQQLCQLVVTAPNDQELNRVGSYLIPSAALAAENAVGIAAAMGGAGLSGSGIFAAMNSGEKPEMPLVADLAIEVMESHLAMASAESVLEPGHPSDAAVAATVADMATEVSMERATEQSGPAAEMPGSDQQVNEPIYTAGPAVTEAISPLHIPPPPTSSPPTPTVFSRSDLPLQGMQMLKVGVIGGSGLGQLLGGQEGRRHEIHTPFGAPSDAIIETEWAGVPVFLLARHGPGHLLNPTQVPYQANIFALKQLGCTHVIATGAVGSLREEMKPRDLAIPEQIIDKTTKRPSTFYDNLAVHVEFSEPFCPVLRQLLVEAGVPAADSTATHATHDRGCYVAMEGPAFSTRAESLMHRLWGGDLIGMTAMPEAKLAREAELSYALVALVTDYDCWRQKPPLAPGQIEQKPTEPVDPFVLLKEIIGNLESASANAMALIRRAIELIASRQDQLMAAPSRNALRLAIWSDLTKIPADEIVRLKVLWGRHFEKAQNEETSAV